MLKRRQKAEYEEKKKSIKDDENAEKFWNEKSEFTPESRIEVARVQEELKQKRQESRSKMPTDDLSIGEKKKERKFFDPEGKPYSFNDPKFDF